MARPPEGSTPDVSTPDVSIIVRTHNEESWIAHCLGMVFRQEGVAFEVIVVDNCSRDHTLPMVRRFPVADILTIEDYLPGLALNMGIERARGRFIACLSAHCIPLDEKWLARLLEGFEADTRIAGVYGRQLPLPFSPAADKRDLLTVFGLDRRVQVRDHFFHNANSMVRCDVLEAYPFDSTLTNVEDRHWGKRVIGAGYRLLYEPEAAVYHHHGINQGGDVQRVRGVSAVLDDMFEEIARTLPETLRPGNVNVAALVPVRGTVRSLRGGDLLQTLLRQLAASHYLSRVYVISENDAALAKARACDTETLDRPDWLLGENKTLGDVLKWALAEIERRGDHPTAILHANYLFPYRPANLFDELVGEMQYKGLDTVFPGYVDYNDHWVSTVDGRIERITESKRPLADRPQLYRSLYGLGCVTHSAFARQGRLVGDKVGIVPIHDHIYTLRCTDESREAAGLLPEPPPDPLPGFSPEMELFLREFRP